MLPPHQELWSIRTTPKSSQQSLVQRLMFQMTLWQSNNPEEGPGCRNALAPELVLRVPESELPITGISEYSSAHLFKYCSTNFIVKINSHLHFLPNQHKIPQNTLWLFCGSPSLYPFFFDLCHNCYRTINFLLLDMFLALVNEGFFTSHLCNNR